MVFPIHYNEADESKKGILAKPELLKLYTPRLCRDYTGLCWCSIGSTYGYIGVIWGSCRGVGFVRRPSYFSIEEEKLLFSDEAISFRVWAAQLYSELLFLGCTSEVVPLKGFPNIALIYSFCEAMCSPRGPEKDPKTQGYNPRGTSLKPLIYSLALS